MAETITIKRGATLSYTGQILENSVAKDITGHTITSQIRDGENALIDYFDITVTSAIDGEYSAVAHAGTANYPIAKLFTDLKVIDALGLIVYSETAFLNVVRSITA